MAGGDAPRLPRSMIAKFSPPTVKGLELKIVFGTEAHMYNDISCDGMQLVRPEAVYIGAEFHRFRRDRYCFLIENCSPPPKPALMFKRLDGCDSTPNPNPNPDPNPNPNLSPNPIPSQVRLDAAPHDSDARPRPLPRALVGPP